MPGVELKHVGPDKDSYHAFGAEIERKDRNGPIVLVSPIGMESSSFNAADLQEKLTGLAQVLQISPGFHSYEMSEVLGQSRSASGTAVNILSTPGATGVVCGRFFLAETITGWGDTQLSRISQVLAWVTNNTSIPRLCGQIPPEGVTQLSLRRRMQTAGARSSQMDAAQLRQVLEQAAKQEAEQAKSLDEVWNECIQPEGRVSTLSDEALPISYACVRAKRAKIPGQNWTRWRPLNHSCSSHSRLLMLPGTNGMRRHLLDAGTGRASNAASLDCGNNSGRFDLRVRDRECHDAP